MRFRASALLGRCLGASILAVIFAAAAPAAVPEKPRAGEAPRGAVLSGPENLEFVQAICGSSADREGEKIALWQPAPADIARLEDRLPGFMSHQKTPSDYQPLYEYYRQYIGVRSEGKKKVCVNFFHYGFLVDTLRVGPRFSGVPPGTPPEDFWKHVPVLVMDGGAYFFQIEFDVETGTFTKLRFNGDA